MYTAALLTLALPFAAQFGAPAAPRDAELIAPVQCFPESTTDSIHTDHLANERIAVVGGNWWVPRFSATGSEIFFAGDTLELRDTVSGDTFLPQVHRSSAAIAVAVPGSASPGGRYQLVAAGAEVAELTVAVGELVATSGEVQNASVIQGGPQRCDIFCAVDGLTVPATPRLSFTQVGGPLVLDAFAVFEGGSFPADEWTHRADSYWLDAVSEPTVIEIDLDELGWDTGLDVYVRARDPQSLVLVHDEQLSVAPLGELPADTEGLAPCSDNVNPQPMGCPFFGGSFLALLFVPALSVRLRRLRKRSSRS